MRKLRNAMKRAILLCDGGLITRQHLPVAAGRAAVGRRAVANETLAAAALLPPGGVDLDEVERGFIERALRDTRGNKSKAACLLGLTRSQLYSRIQKYGVG